jgi:hypothetical protein
MKFYKGRESLLGSNLQCTFYDPNLVKITKGILVNYFCNMFIVQTTALGS